MADKSATAARRVRNHCHGGGRGLRRLKRKGAVVDKISGLPNVILQHILTFVPTRLAITTSLLSRRWRRVWCDTPSLSFRGATVEAAWINKTITRYTAPKTMQFHLYSYGKHDFPYIDRWIEFVMSRHLEIMSLYICYDPYTLPDFFYLSSSLKQLTLMLTAMIPKCSVSWTSLKNLSLLRCIVSDESMAKILSGCPILESLTLNNCGDFRFLDLSKSLRLKTLVVERNGWLLGPAQIVAPHLRCLHLTNWQKLPCTLVDVSSLTEANMDIFFGSADRIFNADFLQSVVLEIVKKLQHVEKLTLGGNILQISSYAELLDVPFPMFKVKALTLKTTISQYVIPGIKRVLQKSHDLKKLTVHTNHCNTMPVESLDKHLALNGLDPAKCWRSRDGFRWNKCPRDVESTHLDSFVELLLKNTKTLEEMFLLLDDPYRRFKKIVRTVSQNNKVDLHCLLRLY